MFQFKSQVTQTAKFNFLYLPSNPVFTLNPYSMSSLHLILHVGHSALVHYWSRKAFPVHIPRGWATISLFLFMYIQSHADSTNQFVKDLQNEKAQTFITHTAKTFKILSSAFLRHTVNTCYCHIVMLTRNCCFYLTIIGTR